MAKKIDITGNKYGKLTAIEDTGEKSSNGSSRWLFRCDCGEEYVARKCHIVAGEMTCCRNCQRLDAKIKATKHGLTYTPDGKKCKTFQAWMNIKKRCHDPENSAYPDYGAKGIVMQKSWLDDPRIFVEYMGQSPSPVHSVERVDRFKGYEEGNVIWALPVTQSRNRGGSRDLPSCVYLRPDCFIFNKKIFGKSHTVRFYFYDEDSKELAELACTEYRELIFIRLNSALPEHERYAPLHGIPDKRPRNK